MALDIPSRMPPKTFFPSAFRPLIQSPDQLRQKKSVSLFSRFSSVAFRERMMIFRGKSRKSRLLRDSPEALAATRRNCSTAQFRLRGVRSAGIAARFNPMFAEGGCYPLLKCSLRASVADANPPRLRPGGQEMPKAAQKGMLKCKNEATKFMKTKDWRKVSHRK